MYVSTKNTAICAFLKGKASMTLHFGLRVHAVSGVSCSCQISQTTAIVPLPPRCPSAVSYKERQWVPHGAVMTKTAGEYPMASG